jgi:hypothetical protein
MKKSKKDFPLVVLGFLPKGHPLGYKTSEYIRKTYFKDNTSAQLECDAYTKMGVTSQIEKR